MGLSEVCSHANSPGRIGRVCFLLGGSKQDSIRGSLERSQHPARRHTYFSSIGFFQANLDGRVLVSEGFHSRNLGGIVRDNTKLKMVDARSKLSHRVE